MTARNHRIEIRFSKEEIEALKRKAKDAELSVSAFLRQTGLKANIEIRSFIIKSN